MCPERFTVTPKRGLPNWNVVPWMRIEHREIIRPQRLTDVDHHGHERIRDACSQRHCFYQIDALVLAENRLHASRDGKDEEGSFFHEQFADCRSGEST